MTTSYGQSGDMARCWYEMIVASDSLRDRSGAMVDFKTFQVSRILLWKAFQDLETSTNTINVTINCRSVIPASTTTTTATSYNSNINAFILGLYNEMYSLVFDEQYRCVSEKLRNT